MSFVRSAALIAAFAATGSAAVAAPHSTVALSAVGRPDALGVIASHRELSTFRRAVQVAGLDAVLAAHEVTVIAPDDAAFAKLGEAQLQTMFDDAHRAELRSYVLNHVIEGRLQISDGTSIVTSGTVTTLGGSTLTIDGDGVHVAIGGARIGTRDLEAVNGYVDEVSSV